MGLLLESLRSVDFLSSETEETVSRFMVSGKCTDCTRGHVFWRAGKVPEALVIPVSGAAKTTTRSPEGREFIDRFLGPGECAGLASALDGLEDPTDAEVVRAGEFFMMPRANFQRFLDAHPQSRAKASVMVGALYRRSLKEREDVALRPVPQRVAGFLLRHACVRHGEGARVLLQVTQAELAARLGTVREVVARIFADLGERGIIERSDSAVFITNWEALRAEAGPDLDEAAVDDRAAAMTRTERFFLPASERVRRHGDPHEAARCQAQLGDLRICRESGCPGAIDHLRRNPPA